MIAADETTARRTTEEDVWRAARTELLGFVRRRVSDETAAEDIVQDVLLRAYAVRGTLRHAGKLRQWLYQIARNTIIDHYRSRAKVTTVSLPDDLPEDDPDAARDAERELAACLTPVLDSLPPRYREALELAELDGLTQRDVADRLGLTLSGAKSRIQRGRAMLADALLDCCRIELDRTGAVLDFERRPDCTCGC